MISMHPKLHEMFLFCFYLICSFVNSFVPMVVEGVVLTEWICAFEAAVLFTLFFALCIIQVQIFALRSQVISSPNCSYPLLPPCLDPVSLAIEDNLIFGQRWFSRFVDFSCWLQFGSISGQAGLTPLRLACQPASDAAH